MPTVKLEKGEPLDRVLRRFKREVEREGILKKLKEEKEYYEKPSQKKRKKYLKAQRRIAYFKRNAQS